MVQHRNEHDLVVVVVLVDGKIPEVVKWKCCCERNFFSFLSFSLQKYAVNIFFLKASGF